MILAGALLSARKQIFETGTSQLLQGGQHVKSVNSRMADMITRLTRGHQVKVHHLCLLVPYPSDATSLTRAMKPLW